MTTQVEQLYELYDSCSDDDEILEIMSLEGMRQWLADFWDNNPNDEMDDEEHAEMIEAIMQADESELCDRLGGIGYHITIHEPEELK